MPRLTSLKPRLRPASLSALKPVTSETARPNAAARGYDWAWQKTAAAFKREHPLCVQCQREGRVTPATVVDHIIPHRGDQRLFWDQSNWQAMCGPCHSRKTASEDGGWGNPTA